MKTVKEEAKAREMGKKAMKKTKGGMPTAVEYGVKKPGSGPKPPTAVEYA